MNTILVTGGTGVLGTAVMKELKLLQKEFICISRNRFKVDTYDTSVINYSLPILWKKADLNTGEGLVEALSNVQTVVHLASSMEKVGKEPSEVIAARHLLNASRKAGVSHFIYISIVGVDKIPLEYFKAKYKVEQMIAQSGIPYTILRATQFHNFMDFQLRTLLRFPIGLIPKKLKFQPVQLEAVAKELVHLSQVPPQKTLLNIGGRQVLELGEMAGIWLKKQGMHKTMLAIPVIGGVMHAFAKGACTCSEIAIESTTWDEYLTHKYMPSKLVATVMASSF